MKPIAGDSERSKVTLCGLLRPYAKFFTIGIAAILVESATNLAEPWPLKLVLDNVLKSKPVHGWLNQLIVSLAGTDKIAILKFAALAVIAIAIVGAACNYAEKFISGSLGQWITHDLRHTLYSHIHQLSLAYHNQKQTGDLVSRLTSDIDAVQSFIASGLLGALINSLRFHVDRALRGSTTFPGRFPLHPPDQGGHTPSADERGRDRLGHSGSLVIHARRQSFWARRV
jgi:ABC-type multidrug transport system fused ATPase/permease subunit